MTFKPISQAAWQRYLAFHAKALDRGSDPKEEAELLVHLGDCKEPSLIPYLAYYIPFCKPEIEPTLAKTIERLLELVPTGSFVEIDRRIREFEANRCSWEDKWRVLTMIEAKLLAGGTQSVISCGFLSFHSNGRVRELAIRRLDEFSTGEELRFLLVRLNDWVDPVRELAHELVLKRLVPAYRDVIFNYLGLILRLKNCARIQQGAILAASVELFCHAEGRAYLSAIATSRDRQVRLGFLKAAVDLENESRIGFARQLLDDPDPHVQFVASRVVLAECYPEELPELTAKLLRSKSPRVRREALQTVVSRVPDLAPQKLLESLVDGNTGVRALALFYLSANSGFNAAQFFRDRLDLASGIQRVGAILGLGETGVARDADAIRILLNAKESKLRKAAVCALGRLRPPGIEADLLLMLGDRSAAVSKQAYNGLLRRNQRDHLEELLGIFEGSEFEHVRLNALKLILLGDKWTVLPFLILNSCGETKIADCANAFLRAWLGSSTRGYYSPSRAQIDLAKESLNSVRGRIQKCIARELDIFLNEIETR